MEISERDSGLHFLMKIKTTLPDSEVVLKLQQNGIKVTALSQYYNEASNDSEHVFIINYSFVNEENLEMYYRFFDQFLYLKYRFLRLFFTKNALSPQHQVP